jgi:hypothetical protein
VIDGLHAVESIIHGPRGGNSSPAPRSLPPRVEIILNAPAEVPLRLQRSELVLALANFPTRASAA